MGHRVGGRAGAVFRDSLGQLALEWSHFPGNGEGMNKRAWVQHREPGSEDDWAGPTQGRYVLVVSLTASGRPLQGPNFPVFSDKTDEQVPMDMATAMMTATGASSSFVDED